MTDAASAVLSVVLTVVVLGVGGLCAAAFGGVLAGPSVRHGLTLPLAETARLLRQRRRSAPGADLLLWRIAGAGLVLVPLLMLAVVPLGPPPVLDSAVGVVWFNTADVAVWALVWLLGWGANATFALVGAFRFLASALAYELPLMFALTAPAVAAHSLRVTDIVAAQAGLPYVVWMPLAFVVLLVGVAGFSVWGSLGPAAGPDLAGGVLGELSGPDRWLALTGRYLLLVAGSVFTAALFLGGGAGPLLPSWCWLLVKSAVLVAALVVLRNRLVLLRPDRFMEIGWLILLPAALLQLLVVSLLVTVGGWS
ncbi:NADH-quinone oxidoreductase subunit H [Friedmanniella endophytica]|uniref:NADH-quinone oxidoreductase subunit H n=1 Tax=Microlunatus kandeliicorticis TaxID=1759536 RepID=A0A7W3IPJ6_9ACTN|nr:NADH-quinone oxidoreductase subunit H [Microlunatus kandeliicorticis]MBA8792887.1 NADH-quinone oxidoreductase subunit H [Microlunatus kandeliicorticis]